MATLSYDSDMDGVDSDVESQTGSPVRKLRRISQDTGGSDYQDEGTACDITEFRKKFLNGGSYPPNKQVTSSQPGYRKPREDEIVVCGQGGAHSYLDGSPKTWPGGGPAGNGLFYWPRDKLNELCLMLVKTRWHMGVNITGPFNFLADFDDKQGAFADALDAGDMELTMKAALIPFFDTEDIEVVPMQRQDRKGWHIWASVVIDMAPGWSSLCQAIVQAWKKELDSLELDNADENTFMLGAGNVLDVDIYKEGANGNHLSLRPPFVQKNHSLDDGTAYIPDDLEELVGAGLSDTAIMRKYIGFAPDGAAPTPLTDLGKQSLTASTSAGGPQSDEKVTEHVNNWLASVLGNEDVPDGVEHFYEQHVMDGGKRAVWIYNNQGLCYTHAATDGAVHCHDDNLRQSLLIFTKTTVKAKCMSHGDVSLTKKDTDAKDFKAVKALVGLTATGMDELLSKGHLLTAQITGILNEYAQEHGLQKEGDCVVWPTLNGFDYAHKDPKRPEDYNTFIDNVANAKPDLRKMLNSDIGLRKKLISFLEDTNDPLFPKLKRDMSAYGCRNGVIFIAPENVEVSPRAIVRMPKPAFSSWADIVQQIETAQRDPFVVRVYIDQDYDSAWESMSIEDMCTAEWEDGEPASGCCPFLIKSFRDQGFDTNMQTFKVQGRSQEWSLMELAIAFLHRTLYATGAYDDYAFMLWFFGRTRTGKTLATDIVKTAYFQQSMIMQVTNSNEDTFGLQAAVGKALISCPDIKRKAEWVPFPLSESNLQTIIEGGNISIARKNKSALANTVVDAPLLVDGNKKVGQIWDDGANAMNNRVAMFEYKKEPPDRRSNLKKLSGPIHTCETLGFLFLGNKCYRKLLSHARHSTFVDWDIAYFLDERAMIEKQNNYLLQFLTLPRGEMGTKDTDIWCVFEEGAQTPVRELKRRYAAWMKFDNNMDVNWDSVNLEESLEKASREHEGTLTLKEPSHYWKCNECKQPIGCNRNTTLPYAPHCCDWYKHTPLHKSKKAKRTSHNKASKREAQKIVGLRINEAPKSGGTQALLPAQPVPANWRWNGNCGCGQTALTRTSNRGVDYYCCFFGAVDDARCKLTYKPCSELNPVYVQNNGSDYPS